MPQAASLETPLAVVRACWVLWCGLAISTLDFTVKNIVWFERSKLASELLGILFGIVVTFWFTGKLKRGRNWMRVLMTTLSVLAVVFVPLMWQVMRQVYLTVFAGQPVQLIFTVAVTLIQYALNLVATILINTRGARIWFRAMKERGYGAA
jgi:hypothetical protein